MRALVFEGKKIDISYAYDGLTIYAKNIPEEDYSEIMNKLYAGHVGLFSENKPSIELGEDQHDYYHKDDLDRTQIHTHFKFRKYIKRNELINLLKDLMDYELINQHELNRWIDDYDERQRVALTEMLSSVTMEKNIDSMRIIANILSKENNDVLVYLYDCLQARQFDYLRAAANDDAVDWKHIEKAFAFQMLSNVKENIVYNGESALQTAGQLKHSHKFFWKPSALERNILLRISDFFGLTSHDELKLLTCYRQGDEKGFETLYQKFKDKFADEDKKVLANN